MVRMILAADVTELHHCAGIRVALPKPGCDLPAFLNALHPDLLTIYFEKHPIRLGNTPPARVPEPTGEQDLSAPAPDVDARSDGGMELDLEYVVAEALVVEGHLQADLPPQVLDVPPLHPRVALYVGTRAAFSALLRLALPRLWPAHEIAPTDDVSALLDYIAGRWSDVIAGAIASTQTTRGRPPPGQATAAEWRERLANVKALSLCFAKTDSALTHKWTRGRFEQLALDCADVLDVLLGRKALDTDAVVTFVASCRRMLAEAM
jgi:hypothetical protein